MIRKSDEYKRILACSMHIYPYTYIYIFITYLKAFIKLFRMHFVYMCLIRKLQYNIHSKRRPRLIITIIKKYYQYYYYYAKRAKEQTKKREKKNYTMLYVIHMFFLFIHVIVSHFIIIILSYYIIILYSSHCQFLWIIIILLFFCFYFVHKGRKSAKRAVFAVRWFHMNNLSISRLKGTKNHPYSNGCCIYFSFLFALSHAHISFWNNECPLAHVHSLFVFLFLIYQSVLLMWRIPNSYAMFCIRVYSYTD